jgi:hypothetical protein
MVALYSIPSFNTSYCEVTSRGVKGGIILHPLNKYFIHYNATFHTSTCDITVWSIYWGDGVWCHLSHLYLWPHSMKYLLRGWSIMPPFTPLLVTSLYEVFIEGMEYNATFHTSTCDLTVWSIYWVDGVWCHLSHLYLWPHRMQYLLSGWSIMLPSTPLLVTSLGHIEKRYERCHHAPFTQQILQSVRSQWVEVWKVSSYSVHWINTSYSEVTSRGVKGGIILHPLNKYFIQSGHKQRCEGCHYTTSFQ